MEGLFSLPTHQKKNKKKINQNYRIAIKKVKSFESPTSITITSCSQSFLISILLHFNSSSSSPSHKNMELKCKSCGQMMRCTCGASLNGRGNVLLYNDVSSCRRIRPVVRKIERQLVMQFHENSGSESFISLSLPLHIDSFILPIRICNIQVYAEAQSAAGVAVYCQSTTN